MAPPFSAQCKSVGYRASPSLGTLCALLVILWFLQFVWFLFTKNFLLLPFDDIVVGFLPYDVVLPGLTDWARTAGCQLPAGHFHLLQLEVQPAVLGAWPVLKISKLLLLTDPEQSEAVFTHSGWVACDIRTQSRLDPLAQPLPQPWGEFAAAGPHRPF